MEQKLTLSDTFQVSGKDMEEFESLVKDLSSATRFVKAKAGQLGFLYKLDSSAVKDAYKAIQFTPDLLGDYQEKLAYYRTTTQECPVPTVGIISKKKVTEVLADEAFDSAGFLMTLDGKLLYVAEGAMATLCMRAGLAGDRTSGKSMYLTQAICEALGAKKEEMTMVIRSLPNENGKPEQKVFAFLSNKYTNIPMDILPEAVRAILADGKLGKSEVTGWYMDHSFTLVSMEFPEAGEEFSELSGLADTVIPGLVLMSSDTGTSSLIIRGTYRPLGARKYVVVDEYSHKHAGTVTQQEIMEACEKNIMGNFRRLPEELANKMGRIIGNGDISTETARKRNEKSVKKAVREGMKALGLQKDLGKQRYVSLLDQMNTEINPSAVYSEYDLAMLFLGLPDRVEGLSREMQTRIAKDCGRAPFISYQKVNIEEEDIILLPEE